MSNHTTTKAQRKVIRSIATGNPHEIPAHERIPKFPFSMFGPSAEEEHLVYPKTKQNTRIRFVMGQTCELQYYTCPICREEILEAMTVNDFCSHTRVCPSCLSNASHCAKCGCKTTSLELATLRDGTIQPICNDCRSDYFAICEDCGLFTYSGLLNRVDNKQRCPRCATAYKKKNFVCYKCQHWTPIEMKMEHPNSAGAYICPTCFASVLQYNANLGKPKKVILPYGKTDGSVFFSTEPGTERFYGLELEAQNGKYPDNQEDALLQDVWHFKECVLKRDGSIPRGYETVTFPLGLDYHIKYFNWQKFCELHERYGFKAHEDPDAGLHIHASRRAWGKTPATQKKRLPALVYLLDREDWRKEWKKFSRRANKYVMAEIDSGNFHGGRDPFHYCSFYNVDWANNTLAEGYAEIVSINHSNRNRILNFQSPPTVEWRMNKSTLVPDTIFATLEMFDVLVDISSGKWTEAKLRAMEWKDLCKAIPGKYNHLVKYLKDQKIWRV